jgi:predicted DNA-binding transcriptional regulator AlpA
MPDPDRQPFQQRPDRPRPEPKPERYLTWSDLEERGLISSRTSARRLWTQGKMPKPVHLSERVIGFRESEIEAWAASRIYDPQPPHGIAVESQARAARKR